jgi:2-desacetyl-2-hydroxyethyl bacteriochlorophyllide A dehydrogenase
MAWKRSHIVGQSHLIMEGLALQFKEPYRIEVRQEPISLPGRDHVLVQTILSAISPGTELLIYRGQWPDDLPVDATIPALAGKFSYPLKYGYAAVGRVIEIGADVDSTWLERRVFAFSPHQAYFLTTPDELTPLPASVPSEEAGFLPSMETAVSFVMDGKPLIGEIVGVFGQGVIGLLTTALLARIPLSHLVTLDKYSLRREKSLEFGANACLDPSDPDIPARLRDLLNVGDSDSGLDLAYELSGNPEALDKAIAVTGFSGRVVIGSWYGTKKASVDLGGRFHRGRIQILSSQVSRLAPELTARWTKSRRLRLALRMLSQIRPSRLITHRFHISRAPEAYALLHEHPGDSLQVIFTYEDL